MADYIFSLGLIPVQEFIAEARRSRDLRAGSAILSWLMTEMLRHLKNQFEIELILPAQKMFEKSSETPSFPYAVKDVRYSFPNRASGKFEFTKEKDEIDAAFGKLPDIIKDRWKVIFEESFVKDDFAKHKTGSYYTTFQTLFKNYPVCPFHALWVVKEYHIVDRHDEKEALKENLKAIEELYTNMKRTRPITSYSNGQPVEKCSQCGRREVPVPEGEKAHKFYDGLSRQPWMEQGLRIDEHEKLCMICFIKRFAGYIGEERFPSTNRIAAADWIDLVRKNGSLKVKYDDFEMAAKKLRKEEPETFLYSFDIKKLKDAYKEKSLELEEVKATRQNLYDAVRDSKDPAIPLRPSNYLAIIVFDGDSMGEKMREYHAKLPSATAEFANEALDKFKHTETSYLAEFFYCGGDEGALLCPISRLLNTLLDLRRLFLNKVKEIDASITLSAGVCIFHHDRPMGAALKTAHEALQRAKSVDKKNSLAITVQTASGSLFTSVARWDSGVWERVQYLHHLMNVPASPDVTRLSSGWAYEIESLLNQVPAEELSKSSIQTPVTAEVKRITYRKLEVPGENAGERRDNRQKVWEKLKGQIWFTNLDEQEREHLANQFHLIAFLGRESQFQIERSEL